MSCMFSDFGGVRDIRQRAVMLYEICSVEGLSVGTVGGFQIFLFFLNFDTLFARRKCCRVRAVQFIWALFCYGIKSCGCKF
jgi:hypothetical protein